MPENELLKKPMNIATGSKEKITAINPIGLNRPDRTSKLSCKALLALNVIGFCPPSLAKLK
jgi:hypothetical protein